MSYCWTITKDYITDGGEPGTNLNAVGVIGPRSATMTAEEIIAHPNREAFRMYDDDGELYYEGFLVAIDSDEDEDEDESEHGFQPLDDFGRPNAGCTEIRYADENGCYITL